MEIVHTEFEKALKLNIHGHDVEVVLWKTDERDNFKLGISAPRACSVDREEVYKQKNNGIQK